MPTTVRHANTKGLIIMKIHLTIDQDDVELIINQLTTSLRAANSDADKYYDMNTQAEEDSLYRESVIGKILSLQSTSVIDSFVEGIKQEKEKLLADEQNKQRELASLKLLIWSLIDNPSDMASNPNEMASVCYLEQELTPLYSSIQVKSDDSKK